MKPAPFTYHRPDTLADVLALLADLDAGGEEVKVLAGGQSLLPVMALRLAAPDHVVDIGHLPGLDAIDIEDPGRVRIGALVRHAAAERSDTLARSAPLVHQAMPHVGHRAIRTRGTVAGSVAHADPAAEMPAVCLAIGATMELTSTDGVRTVPADEFFTGYLSTALTATEVLTAIEFPTWPVRAGSAVVELSRRHGDYALLGLACGVELADDDTIRSAALSFFGVGSVPVRVAEAEDALVGRPPTSDTYAVAAHIASESLDPVGDIHATAAYRRHIAGVLVEQGLSDATERVGATTAGSDPRGAGR